MHHQPTIDPSVRCRLYLERAGAPDASSQRPGWAPLLARLWVNDQPGAAAWIRALIAECDQHQDCTDFRLNLLMGLGEADGPAPGHIGDFVATTAWRPPEWLVRLALALEPSMVNRERHRQPGKLHYTCHSIFWKFLSCI